MKAKLIGVGIFVVIAAIVIWFVATGQGLPPVKIQGYVGGEKIGFLEDKEIAQILKDQYKLSIDYTKMGSLDMATAYAGDQDFLFPSSSLAAELYRANGGTVKRSEDAFVSPIVIYSWDKVTDALVEADVAAQTADGIYSIDMRKLVALVEKDTTWADLGLPELFGSVCVFSTDPLRSNSGNLLTALVATSLNGDKTVTQGDIPDIIDPLRGFLGKSGYKETSSADLFSQYLRTGMGGKALVALYENQMIEYAEQYPQQWAQIRDRVRVLYPTPTVFSNHVFIARDDEAIRFLDAMQNDQIQRIAWEKHGFRTGDYGLRELPQNMQGVSVKAEINSVIQLPDYATMNQLMQQLE